MQSTCYLPKLLHFIILKTTARNTKLLPFSLEAPIRFAGQGLHDRGATGAASVRSCQKFPLRVTNTPAAHGDPLTRGMWRSLFLEDCTPWKGPTLEQLMTNMQSLGRTHTRQVHGGLPPPERVSHWSETRVRRFFFLRRNEWQR